MLGAIILTIHNMHFINKLVEGAREAILEGTFQEYKEKFLEEYSR
jgi:queuine tRNA-ribosyltransferase